MRHVFFVAETKGTMDTLELSGVEKRQDRVREEALQRDEHGRRALPQCGNVRGPARGNGQDELGHAYES